MIRYFLSIISLSLLTGNHVLAQDTLPEFSVVRKSNNRNVISWTNNYPYTTQISIQRANDSTRNFTTILTVPDPMVPQNGFVDTRFVGSNVFYRIFIVLDGGKYQFTHSKRPAPDTASVANEPVLTDNQRVKLSDDLSNNEVTRLNEKLQLKTLPLPRPEKFFVVKRKNVTKTISQKNFKKFRDSIVNVTKDTLVFESVDTIVIKPFVPKPVYKASRYVYTEKFGNVMISLPEAGHKKYSISFFEENRSPLFEIKEVKSPSLVLDKTNFVHSGWFWFELYENGNLKEKHKFFIPKDF